MGTCISHEPEVDFDSPVDFNHFHILRAIGKGAFGKVCIVKKKDTKQMYAMKYMNKIQIIRKHAVENVFRENKILCSLEHPFLVNLWFTFQDREDMFMVLDLMLGGDISYHLEKHGKFSLERVRLYMAELSLALEYLRSKRIIHRDLKPANMLLDSQGHVHLTDFNVATFVRSNVSITSTTGTKPYMAPEVVQASSKGYSYGVDWWSLGVSAYEMLRGHRPFVLEKNMSSSAMYNLLMHTRPSASINWDSNTCDVLKMLLHPDDHKRLQTADSMRKHPFFKELSWEEVQQKKATPAFIPPQNRINCDPTHELEEMIVEPNPLHKKRHRLSKRNVRTEEESIEIELDKISNQFREYDRQKDQQQKEEKLASDQAQEKSSIERLVEEACSDPNTTESGSGTGYTATSSAKENTSPAKEVLVTAEVTETGEASQEEKTGDGDGGGVEHSNSQAAVSEITVNVDDLLEDSEGKEGKEEKQEGSTAAIESNAPSTNSVQDTSEGIRTILSPTDGTLED